MKKLIITGKEFSDISKSAVKYISTQSGLVFILDNKVVKLFNNGFLSMEKNVGINSEKRILAADGLRGLSNISFPKEILYDNEGNYIGYTMDFIPGDDLNKTIDKLDLTQLNLLKGYADIFSELEKIVIAGNNKGIVFPDLATCENIISTENGLVLIDYDGMQINNIPTLGLSTAIGQIAIQDSKYLDIKRLIYSTEVDKLSLVCLYFLGALHINLSMVGQVLPDGHIATLEEIFSYVELDDVDIMHKVWKLFQHRESNEFLGSDLYRMSEIYDLKEMNYCGHKIRRLVRK